MLKKKVVVFILLLVLVVSFTACDLKDLGKPESEQGNKEVSVIVGETKYMVKTDTEYVDDLLLEMKNNGQISYTIVTSEYGDYLTAIGDLSAGSSSFISVYHDIDDDITLIDKSEWASPNYTYENKTYFPSNVGISSLPVKNGHGYAFVLIEY